MANLPEVDQYDAGVYQLETTDPALGGANGLMNTPPKSLVNRTRYLLNRMLDGALSFIVDSGAANAVVASLPQPIGALVDGMEVSFRVGALNTTATTLKLTNTGGPTLAILPLYGGDYAAMAGGELPAGATVRAKLNMTLNSGSGAWVVQSIAGGYAKIPTPAAGDTSTKAANMAALFTAADGMATINVSVGADITLTAAQYGCAILKLTGTPTAAINLILPASVTGQWIIWNQQGGTNNITAKPSGGTGVVLPQGNAASIVVSDGAVASFASAQAGQVSFTPITITGVTGTTLTVSGGYTPGALMIEKNGYLLEPGTATPDFTATASPTVTLKTAAVSTDVFTVYRFVTFNVANAVQKSGDTLAGPLVLAGGDTGVTPAQFDNSAKLATTAALKRQGLQASGITTLAASATLDTSYAGGTVLISSSSATTQTLPAASSFPSGARIEFFNAGSGTATISRAGTDTISFGGSSSSLTSVAVGTSDTLVIESNGSNAWLAVDGSVALPYSGLFGSSLVGNGYQKLPSGMIVQWGQSSGTNGVVFNLPIAFPNSALGALVADAGSTRNSYGIGNLNTATYTIWGPSTSWTANWMVWGH